MSQLRADGLCIALRAGHDQEGIVAGQGSDNIFPFQGVKHLTGGVRHAGVAFDQNDVSGKIHPQNRLVEDRLKTALDLRVQRLVVAGNIPVAGARGRFDQAELPDIAGDRGLCGIESLISQVVEQGLLTADRMLLDQPQDRLLTLPLGFGIASAAGHIGSPFCQNLPSAAQFLVDGLKLVGFAEGDELHDLVAQPHFGGGTGMQRIACRTIAADEDFLVRDLTDTDVDLAFLRKHHGRTGQTVRADGRDDHALGLRVQDGPAGCQRIGRGAGWRSHDHTISAVMLDQNVIAVDAEINGLLQTAFGDDDIVEGVALPAVVAQNADIKQHPVVQQIISPCNGRELLFHLVDLTGGQKAAAPQVDAEDGLPVFQREVSLVQDGAIPADGQDDIRFFEAFLLRQILHAHRVAHSLEVGLHQHPGTVGQQDLRGPLRDAVGHRFAGVG